MADETGKKVSLGKRLAVCLLLGLVTLISFMVGWMIFGPSSQSEPNTVSEGPTLFTHIFIMLFFGCFSLGAGALGYLIAFSTQCFTFNYHKPFWSSLKTKLYVTNIFVVLFIALGIGFFASMVLTPILTTFGLPWTVSFIAPFFGMLIIVQFLSVWMNIWAPLEKSAIRNRLPVLGISKEDMDRGMYTGISDPAKSSFKKLTMVEEDVGMLWIEGHYLIYRGDATHFRIERHQLIEVERATDPGSMSAYGGAVHVILRFRTEDGTERRTRLHPLGCWTLGSVAKSSDSLASKLTSWQKSPSSTDGGLLDRSGE